MNSVGCHRISARPMTSRGTPASAYMIASSRHRRSPCRMPICAPVMVIGTAATAASRAVGMTVEVEQDG